MSMRLLNVLSQELVQPDADAVPKYAILSHTWGNDEVLYENFRDGSFESKESYRTKVRPACARARDDGYEFIWIDTCNIDKGSSAELSEAINSMYRWYQNAEVCYTYLSDVSSNDVVDGFRCSRWFDRGWTLQELLAPSKLEFFDKDWKRIGDKLTLVAELSGLTTISEDILLGTSPPRAASIAQRMSWAAHRKTTRPEDLAYCLMGVFDVAMPMLYGEGGPKAFLRLQEEIMKQSDDQSIFAWIEKDASQDAHYGLLAISPSQFAYSGSVIPYTSWDGRAPYSMTNLGVQIQMSIAQKTLGFIRAESSEEDDSPAEIFLTSGKMKIASHSTDEDALAACIACPVPPGYEQEKFLGVYIKKTGNVRDQYVRVRAGDLAVTIPDRTPSTIYFRQVHSESSAGIYPRHIFQLRRWPKGPEFRVWNGRNRSTSLYYLALESEHRGSRNLVYNVPKKDNTIAIVLIVRMNGLEFVILLGSATNFRFGFDARQVKDFDETPNSFRSLQHGFQPKLSGQLVDVGHLVFSVVAQPRIDNLTKIYDVDLKIGSAQHLGVYKDSYKGPAAPEGKPKRNLLSIGKQQGRG